LLIALGFEFVNGFHDTANAVATVIYTHSLPPLVAQHARTTQALSVGRCRLKIDHDNLSNRKISRTGVFGLCSSVRGRLAPERHCERRK
jgi:hypothetical protein